VPIFYGDWLVLSALANDVGKALGTYARGTLIDVGCGAKPYRRLGAKVDRWIGIDVADNPEADLHGIAYELPVGDATVDTVLCTQVLEHLEEPARALREFLRVLRPGGYLILAAPQYWPLHEEPRDFFRYTSIGLRYLMTEAGFEFVDHATQGAGAMVAAQALNNAIYCAGDTFRFAHLRWFKATKAPFYLIINILGWLAALVLRTQRDVLNHLIVCRKPFVSE
jgi:SAM-dependent methyltransferase